MDPGKTWRSLMTRYPLATLTIFRHDYNRRKIWMALPICILCYFFVCYSKSISLVLQFVNFTDIMTKKSSPSEKETAFALAALMEIPFQYKAAIELELLGLVPYTQGLCFIRWKVKAYAINFVSIWGTNFLKAMWFPSGDYLLQFSVWW